MRRWIVPALTLVLATLCGAPLVGADEEAPKPSDAAWKIVLEKALPGGKPLNVYVSVREGKVAATLGTAPTFNAVSHTVEPANLVFDRGRLRGTVGLTIHPDNYVPTDGKPFGGRLALDVKARKDGLAGTFRGKLGGELASGLATGKLMPHFDPESEYGKLKMRFIGGLVRLFRLRKASWKYALDMNLTVPVDHGTIGVVRYETVVPDYRRYSAIVTDHDLKVAGDRLTGTFTADVQYDKQSTERTREVYVYALHGTVIGDAVGGAWDAEYDDESAKGQRFLGVLDRTPPPEPAESVAFLRLHDAMQGELPVLLNLSLADDGLINGFAYAPGYNHQVHAVDASKLRLEGGRLRGPVDVAVTPDCYKPPEHFTMHFEVDVAFKGEAAVGTFTGEDRGTKSKGPVTGELRAKRTRDVPLKPETLKRCRLTFGYALVSGPMPKKEWKKHRPNYLNVLFEFDERGRTTKVRAMNPNKEDFFDATVTDSDFEIDGDRLFGDVTFDLDGPGIKNGTYRYAFEAIVDGSRLRGYWRGRLGEEPIYTKSAKLGGELILEK